MNIENQKTIVSGINTVYILENPNLKIILFGDNHQKSNVECKIFTDNQNIDKFTEYPNKIFYRFDRWIFDYLNFTKEQIDFYLESADLSTVCVDGVTTWDYVEYERIYSPFLISRDDTLTRLARKFNLLNCDPLSNQENKESYLNENVSIFYSDIRPYILSDKIKGYIYSQSLNRVPLISFFEIFRDIFDQTINSSNSQDLFLSPEYVAKYYSMSYDFSEELSNVFYNFIYDKWNSILLKFFQKDSNVNYFNIEITKYINGSFNYNFEKYFDNFFEGYYRIGNKVKINDFIISLFSFHFELNTLMRIINRDTNTIFIYAGYFHIENLKDMLQTYFGFEIKYSKVNNFNNACLEISDLDFLDLKIFKENEFRYLYYDDFSF